MTPQSTPEDEFIKKLEFYLSTPFNEFSCNRIKTYLSEYREDFPTPVPIIIRRDRIVFRTVPQSKVVKNKEKKEIKIDNYKILNTVSLVTGVSINAIVGKNRETKIITPRHIAMYLIRDINDSTLESIGELFNRDHTTVLYSITHVRKMLTADNKDYCRIISECTDKLFPTKKVKVA